VTPLEPLPGHDLTCPYQRRDGSRCECGELERQWRARGRHVPERSLRPNGGRP
jgi:hypothetical protein